jgi:CDGSH-type Zn-finger protein/uncharacterized membrane protein YozB (DUF420 family)
MSTRAPAETSTIEVARNGPYRVSNAPRILDSHGAEVHRGGRVALCRCGNSSKKPLCDGTHAKIGFDGTRLAVGAMAPSQAYRGTRITIHDNRDICAHSGVCTDNLPGVFRLGQEPWIDSSAAEAAAVIALVKRCPSGALTCTIGDTAPAGGASEPLVTASKNGPYFVMGGVQLKCDGVKPIVPERYALCRCGGSKNKPFCDGTHWSIGFDETRGRQVGSFAPPFGLKRFSIATGVLLIAGVAAAIIGIEAAGKWTAKGFLGSSALIPDLNLTLELLLVAGLTFGYWLAKRGNIAAHRYNQTIWVLVNTVLVVLIMARGMDNAAVESAADLAKIHIWVPWLHATLGAITVASGLWLVLQMNGLLPKQLHVRGWKTLMRISFAGYWLVALLGIAIYYVWFIR